MLPHSLFLDTTLAKYCINFIFTTQLFTISFCISSIQVYIMHQFCSIFLYLQTFQDWGDLYKCHKFESGDTDAYSVFSSSSTHQRRRDAAEYVDWRSKGVVTQVKSQVCFILHTNLPYPSEESGL